MIRKLLLLPVLALGTLLAGCGVISVTDANHMDHGMMGDSAGFSSSDIMFAQMMIPHHQQAVDMGTLAETRASNPKVKELAAQIKGEQAPEILQMKAWLKATGSDMDMGHDMGMNGMLSNEDMNQLSKATGSAFDVFYLQGMISHHEGAIAMAKDVLNSKNAEVKKLAELIVKTQTEQIAYIKKLQQTLSN